MYSTMYTMYFIERLSSRRHSYERRLHAVLNMKPQRKESSAADKGIGGKILEVGAVYRRGYFSFPLSGNFERGVLLGKMRYTNNTVISYYYSKRYETTTTKHSIRLPQNTRRDYHKTLDNHYHKTLDDQNGEKWRSYWAKGHF